MNDFELILIIFDEIINLHSYLCKPGSRGGKLLLSGSLHFRRRKAGTPVCDVRKNDEEMKIYPNWLQNHIGLKDKIKNQRKMDNKESISNIERQNVLNNRFAVEAIQKALRLHLGHISCIKMDTIGLLLSSCNEWKQLFIITKIPILEMSF